MTLVWFACTIWPYRYDLCRENRQGVLVAHVRPISTKRDPMPRQFEWVAFANGEHRGCSFAPVPSSEGVARVLATDPRYRNVQPDPYWTEHIANDRAVLAAFQAVEACFGPHRVGTWDGPFGEYRCIRLARSAQETLFR